MSEDFLPHEKNDEEIPLQQQPVRGVSNEVGHGSSALFRSSIADARASLLFASIYIKDSTLERMNAPEYKSGLVFLWNNLTGDIIEPNIYLKAAGETLALALATGWMVSLVFLPDYIRSNPLKDRIGYNNVCVGWDMPPASYFASPIVGATVYLGLRFVFTSIVKYDLMLENGLISEKKHSVSVLASKLFGLAYCSCLPVGLVCTPIQHVWWHTFFFVAIIYTRLAAVLVSFWTTKGSLDSLANRIFVGLYTVVSLSLPIMAFWQYFIFDIHPGYKERLPGKGFIPAGIMMTFDFTWFLCIAILPKFLPNEVMIRRKLELVATIE